MQVFNLQAFNKKRLQQRRFPVKFAKFLRTLFFTKHLRWLLLANGAPYLVKLQVTFFIKKNWTSFTRDFYHNLKKALFQKSLSGNIFLQNIFQWQRIENLKTTLHFLKEKKRLLVRATRFSIEKYGSMKLKKCWRE